MATYHRPKTGATILAILFALGTGYVLLEDVLRHGADFTTAHLQTILAIIGTIAAGHMCLPALSSRRWLPAAGCALMFIAGTVYLVTASGARNALIAHDKSARAEKLNEERAAARAKLGEAEADLAAAKRAFETAKEAAARECATGKGSRCGGRAATREAAARDLERADSHASVMRARLSVIPAEADASAGYAHAGRLIAALVPGVTAAPDVITERLQLVMPFILVVILELGTLVFASLAMPQAQPVRRPAPAETAQTSFPASDLGSVREFLAQHRGEPPRPPQPPKPGRRARPQAARQEREREAVVRSFVESYRARHGRDPAPREVRQATGLPRASAHRWQRRVG